MTLNGDFKRGTNASCKGKHGRRRKNNDPKGQGERINSDPKGQGWRINCMHEQGQRDFEKKIIKWNMHEYDMSMQ